MNQQEVTIAMDGQVLRGRGWVTPADWAEAEVARGELGSMKGATSVELPSLAELTAPPGGGNLSLVRERSEPHSPIPLAPAPANESRIVG